VDIKIKLTNIKGEKVKIQIWDTAGQERFKTLTTNIYRGVHGLMIVYDVSDEFSFSNVRNWITHLDKHTDTGTVRLLIGNKVDATNRVS
jgi:Ras-related protein Rab-1A